MRRLLSVTSWGRAWWVLGLVLLLIVGLEVGRAADSAIKVEAILIWATNDSKSPDSKHKPVEPEIKKKLSSLPLKWSHYFEVNRKLMEIPVNGGKKEALSKKCTVEVKNLGRSKVELSLIGEGEQVVQQTQELPVSDIIALGGNAPNETAWLVVFKRKL